MRKTIRTNNCENPMNVKVNTETDESSFQGDVQELLFNMLVVVVSDDDVVAAAVEEDKVLSVETVSVPVEVFDDVTGVVFMFVVVVDVVVVDVVLVVVVLNIGRIISTDWNPPKRRVYFSLVISQ